MTPTELINIALRKAKIDLLHELEKMEFVYESPLENVNDGIVRDFAQHCLNHIARLCSIQAKKNDEHIRVNIHTDLYRIEEIGSSHILRCRDYLPVEIRKVPSDIQDILKEFGSRRPYFCVIVEEIVKEFKARCKASEIAKIAVSAITDTILANRRMKLRIHCSPDGYWRCLLYSDQESVGYPFFTTAETIVEDILRILNQKHITK